LSFGQGNFEDLPFEFSEVLIILVIWQLLN
jgi:hypothetical protein